MTPEQFALHSTPANRSAIYTVYRPNQGYKDDRTLERCEEYDNVLLALTQTNKQLSELKQQFESQTITETEYYAQRKPLAERFNYLEKHRKALKQKYGIIKKYGKEPEFTQILLDELYRQIDPDRFQAAVRVAKQKFHDLLQK